MKALKRVERKLRRSLRKLEERERLIALTFQRLELLYAKLGFLRGAVERVREADAASYAALRESLRLSASEIMAMANELEELKREAELAKEEVLRLLALVEVLKERSRRPRRPLWARLLRL